MSAIRVALTRRVATSFCTGRSLGRGGAAAEGADELLATETATLRVGDRAPDFDLAAHDGSQVSLAGLRGKKVVLAFFSYAFTGT